MEIFVRFAGRMLLFFLEYFAASFVIVSFLIFLRGRSDKNTTADYLIILGGKVFGNKASPTLLFRIDRAYEYLKANPGVIAVASGNISDKLQIETEARVIFEGLVKKGIDPERILLEEKATSTFENFIYSKRLIQGVEGEDGIQKLEIAFVSSDYHILRAFFTAYRAGMHVRCIASKSPPDKPKYYLKEYLLLYPLIFNRLDKNNIEEENNG